jgi:hypothetical protein
MANFSAAKNRGLTGMTGPTGVCGITGISQKVRRISKVCYVLAAIAILSGNERSAGSKILNRHPESSPNLIRIYSECHPNRTQIQSYLTWNHHYNMYFKLKIRNPILHEFGGDSETIRDGNNST